MDGTTMDYLRFGSGEKHLLILPGLGDGLRTVKGMALPMALLYRDYAREYTVWMMSRKNELPKDCSTRQMANDVKKAMVQLGIGRAHVLGVSMGGMIGQYLAIDAPEAVERLVLAVTCPRPNPVLCDAMETWMGMARRGEHRQLMADNMRRMYTETYVRRNGWTVPLVAAVTKPASYRRFLVMAQACVDHNCDELLPSIAAPTLVIGGGADRALGAEGSCRLAERIPRSRLHLYPRGTHALYEEEKDFHPLVLDFLRSPLA